VIGKVPMVVTATRTVTAFCWVSECFTTPESRIENSEALWEVAVQGRLLYDDTEVTAAEEALWVCLECLGPLAVTGAATQLKVTLAENATRPSMTYGSLSDVRVVCADDGCGSTVKAERHAALLDKLGYSTSDVD
jgi:hypothetical protein